MTITCSNCDKPFDITTDDHLVACPWCGQATFSPGADDGPEEEEDTPSRPRAEEER